MLPRPYRMKTLKERAAWEHLLTLDVLTDYRQATTPTEIMRLEIPGARFDFVDVLAEACPVEWAAERRQPNLFRDSWVELDAEFWRGDLKAVAQLLRQVAVHEAVHAGALDVAIELLVWAFIYGISAGPAATAARDAGAKTGQR